MITQGVHVENAQWEEMGNGAMRLTAKLNGQGYKVSAYIGKTYIPRLGRLYSQCGNIPFP